MLADQNLSFLVQRSRGFTLIELSIVLVIIGLIAGGILVGRDLINAAAIRAQINQIDQYQHAVNSFRGKYGFLPGDIPDPDATRFGFVQRGGAGQGDGDGLVAGVVPDGSTTKIWGQAIYGEPTLLWVDLSTAKMIAESFSTAVANSVWASAWGATSGTIISRYFPLAKLGGDQYVYTYNAHHAGSATAPYPAFDFNNFFVVSKITRIFTNSFSCCITGRQGMTVKQAYAIDSKIDDGSPTLGNITVAYASPAFGVGYMLYSNDDNVGPSYLQNGYPEGIATTAGPTTCYDNNGAAGATHYSLSYNNGNGVNCALSFKFQ